MDEERLAFIFSMSSPDGRIPMRESPGIDSYSDCAAEAIFGSVHPRATRNSMRFRSVFSFDARLSP